MISPDSTYTCEFQVRSINSNGSSGEVTWTGDGTATAAFGPHEGMFGFQPSFELSDRWLTIFPTRGLVRKFPMHYFDNEKPRTNFEPLRTDGNLERKLKAKSIYVGPAIVSIVQVGDKIYVWYGGGCGRGIALQRREEILLFASTVPSDNKTVVCDWWDEYEPVREPADTASLEPAAMLFAKTIRPSRAHITVKVGDTTILCIDGEHNSPCDYFAYVVRRDTERRRSPWSVIPTHISGTVGCGKSKWMTKEDVRELTESVNANRSTMF